LAQGWEYTHRQNEKKNNDESDEPAHAGHVFSELAKHDQEEWNVSALYHGDNDVSKTFGWG